MVYNRDMLATKRKLLSDDERSKSWCVTMPPKIVRKIDERRGPVERSTWIRHILLKELEKGKEQQQETAITN
jgi:hypothetical protein